MRDNLTIFGRSAIGAAIGAAVYSLISGPLAYGQLYIVPSITAGLVFGGIFGFLSMLVHQTFRPSLTSTVLLGAASVILFALVVWLFSGIGLGTIIANPELPWQILGLTALSVGTGLGGYLGLRYIR